MVGHRGSEPVGTRAGNIRPCGLGVATLETRVMLVDLIELQAASRVIGNITDVVTSSDGIGWRPPSRRGSR
ncbi:hypothetical protein B296_00026745 [Ensete ventricosum]|uniref:Uncharacterized protein n=1 Tax=Ensete ventricosum TaxID=4639 RepID=A0A426Z6C8_ENSVE|nr:hypothetical protein B296_00026745 [Ensete ventricosum]